MSPTALLDLVDTRDFRRLFIDELGWENPDRPRLTVEADDQKYALDQVAGYKGLRIWHCDALPPRRSQRAIDALVGKDNAERLVIFSGPERQEWRWPRRAKLGGTNAKLLVHEHVVGTRNDHLESRLEAIRLDFDTDIPLVVLLDRMRDVFDVEAETASVQAARLMGTLYAELEGADVPEETATRLLARLLFLFFGDDGDMWDADLFHHFIRDHTTAETLHTGLGTLFSTLDTPEDARALLHDDPCAPFRYVNGELYAGDLEIPPLGAVFRDSILEACEFNWDIISPAVFGSMFQTVRSQEARREGGEHYTTEENILKAIEPLFLDEYRDRLDAAWHDKAQLTRLHNELGRIRVLDPACGCGNFLIVAYRELRAIELDLLRRRRDLDLLDQKHSGAVSRAQLSIDVTQEIKVTLDHFYGIEIEEWPARIAETAMLIIDHLANQRMAQEFGVAPDRLPISIAPTIVHANALHTDWAEVVAPSNDVIIVGNPPFVGQYTKTARQTADTKSIWGDRYNGYLDYVTCWYAKAIDYFGSTKGRWALVSTNSICQGEAVEYLWRPILNAGWRCRFAHRSFKWVSEASGGAGVHVSIIGFDKLGPPAKLWTYPEGGRGEQVCSQPENINPYLADGPDVLVSSRTAPLSGALPHVTYGSKPTDGGHLLVGPNEYDEIAADPVAARYLRRFVGARELLYDLPRWCLWLKDAPASDIARSPVLRTRVASVRDVRLQSSDSQTVAAADRPALFQYDRQLDSDYLAIPAHVGETRKYFTAARLGSAVICGNANFMAPDPGGFLLGILSSSMFIAWMRAVGGRLESRLRFSGTFTYNSFPLPAISQEQRDAIAAAAAQIIDAREAHVGKSLADLYAPGAMPRDLVEAHDACDRVIDPLFDAQPLGSEAARQEILFEKYAAMMR